MQRKRKVHTGVMVLPIIASALLFVSGTVSAHTTGAAYEQKSGAYTTDIGYNPVLFTAGEYASFDFLLWKGPANTDEPIDYKQVWVRIIHEEDTLLATGVFHQPFGPTSLLYDFAKPGSYTLEASYRTADGDEIASSTFPIRVAVSPGGFPFSAYNLSLLPAVLGLIGGFLLTRLNFRFWSRKDIAD